MAVSPPERVAAVVRVHGRDAAVRGGAKGSDDVLGAAGDGAAAEAARSRGNESLKGGDALGAFEAYTCGLLDAPASWEGCVALYGNRSAAGLALGWHESARDDACRALFRDGTFVKGWFRLARALVELGDGAAVACCEHACRLAPRDPALRDLRARAVAESATRYKAAAAVSIAVATRAAVDEGAASDSDEDLDDMETPECVKVEVATLTQTTGGTVWDAAVLLAHWLADAASLDVAGLRCLEVGAGCGTVGLACAALGARHVALTDNDDEVVALLRRNADRNGFASLVDAYALDFCKEPTEGCRADFDVVVGSECVYYESCDAIADLVSAAVPATNADATRPCGVFCMADSRVGIDAFAAAAHRAGFAYERKPFPRGLRRRARIANPGLNTASENTHSVHLLYRRA